MSNQELKSLLHKAEGPDFEFLVTELKSWYRPGLGNNLEASLNRYLEEPSSTNKHLLVNHLDREIRYAGSADGAYLARWMLYGDGGVDEAKLVEGVAKKLKVKLKPLGTVEAKLERLVRATVEKQFARLSPDKQREYLRKQGLKEAKIEEIQRLLKRQGPVAALPVIMRVAGQNAVEKLLTNLVMNLVARVVGKQAAKKLVEELAKKYPGWAAWLGPIAWVGSGVWLAVDLQGPAYRKTVPILLYLGLVGLRDGPEDGPSFWEET